MPRLASVLILIVSVAWVSDAGYCMNTDIQYKDLPVSAKNALGNFMHCVRTEDADNRHPYIVNNRVMPDNFIYCGTLVAWSGEAMPYMRRCLLQERVEGVNITPSLIHKDAQTYSVLFGCSTDSWVEVDIDVYGQKAEVVTVYQLLS